MRANGQTTCGTFTLHKFTSDEKLGSLYRVAIMSNPAIAVFFPHGCREAYFIVNDTGRIAVRAGHVHAVGTKAEMFVVVCGKAEVVLHSLGGCGTITLQSPKDALLVKPGVWHSVHLTPGAILLVFSSITDEEDSGTKGGRPCKCAG
jgi:oxalate decarboxylase/phosphoglucose isomerase-like protein (cupin superfamily)